MQNKYVVPTVLVFSLFFSPRVLANSEGIGAGAAIILFLIAAGGLLVSLLFVVGMVVNAYGRNALKIWVFVVATVLGIVSVGTLLGTLSPMQRDIEAGLKAIALGFVIILIPAIHLIWSGRKARGLPLLVATFIFLCGSLYIASRYNRKIPLIFETMVLGHPIGSKPRNIANGKLSGVAQYMYPWCPAYKQGRSQEALQIVMEEMKAGRLFNDSACEALHDEVKLAFELQRLPEIHDFVDSFWLRWNETNPDPYWSNFDQCVKARITYYALLGEFEKIKVEVDAKMPSEDLAEILVESSPNDAVIYLKKNSQESHDYWDRAWAQRSLGAIYYRQDKTAELAELAMSLTYNESDCDTAYPIAAFLDAQGDWKAASHVYRSMKGKFCNREWIDSRLRVFQAREDFAREDFAKALQEFESLAQLQDSNEYGYGVLSQADIVIYEKLSVHLGKPVPTSVLSYNLSGLANSLTKVNRQEAICKKYDMEKRYE